MEAFSTENSYTKYTVSGSEEGEFNKLGDRRWRLGRQILWFQQGCVHFEGMLGGILFSQTSGHTECKLSHLIL